MANGIHPPKIYAIWVETRAESPMAGEKELAECLGIPVRSISTEEIQSMELSHTEGMGMSMAVL